MSIKYTKVYLVSDLSKEDIKFLQENEFNVYYLNDFEDM